MVSEFYGPLLSRLKGGGEQVFTKGNSISPLSLLSRLLESLSSDYKHMSPSLTPHSSRRHSWTMAGVPGPSSTEFVYG